MAEPLREGSRDFAICLIAPRSSRFGRNETREGIFTAGKNTSYYHRSSDTNDSGKMIPPSPIARDNDSSGFVRKRHWRCPRFAPLAVFFGAIFRPAIFFFLKYWNAAGRESSRRQVIPDISNLLSLACTFVRITRPSCVLHACVRLPCLRFSLPSSVLLFPHFPRTCVFISRVYWGVPRNEIVSENPVGQEKSYRLLGHVGRREMNRAEEQRPRHAKHLTTSDEIAVKERWFTRETCVLIDRWSPENGYVHMVMDTARRDVHKLRTKQAFAQNVPHHAYRTYTFSLRSYFDPRE